MGNVVSEGSALSRGKKKLQVLSFATNICVSFCVDLFSLCIQTQLRDVCVESLCVGKGLLSI